MTGIYLNNISIRFNPEDIWVGVYWRSYNFPDYNAVTDRIERLMSLSLYVCILPMLPICFKFSWVIKSVDAEELRKLYAQKD